MNNKKIKIEPFIVHLDGMDKTGKDTIQDLLVKKTIGKSLVFNRSYISQISYSKIYSRPDVEKYFWENFDLADNRCEHFIYLYANKEDVAKRFIEHDEKDMKIEDYEKHKTVFDQVIDDAENKWFIDVLKLNTSELTPNECVDQILEYSIRNK